MSNSKNTNINWITVPRRGESEYCRFQKSFSLDRAVERAIIRFEADCVCAVYVNGDFVISGTGRYPERVNCHEITSKLCPGENRLEILLGGNYIQKFGRDVKEKRGYWFNQAALELEIKFADKTGMRIPTNDTWIQIDPEEELPIIQTMQVTRAEYDTMWKHAALWKETHNYEPAISKEVQQVAGSEYVRYAGQKQPERVSFEKIVHTDMNVTGGLFEAGQDQEECSLIIDMGRQTVGYVEFTYRAAGAVTVNATYDATEQLKDFEPETDWARIIGRLVTSDKLSEGEHFYRNIRRRAFRYLKLVFRGDLKGFSFRDFGVRLCMFPETVRGWFQCSDDILNLAWEVGKYTLHINKQQEYESCPKNEMMFFSGDGAMDALIDLYAFGDFDMLKTSLSIKHEEASGGISNTTKFNRTVWQWDYFAWRIICVYNYYRHTGDKEFLRRHYGEGVNNILWLTERMNDRDLLYQIPAYVSLFNNSMAQVDWSCSLHRLGENVFLNCLLYKSFVCMSELAEDMEDQENGEKWKGMAERVKKAVNTYLWSEEKGAYVDGMRDSICQDANVFAVLFGVADEERTLSALNTVKERLWSDYGSAMADINMPGGDLRGGITTISPMMSAREAEVRFMMNQPEEGLDLIRRVWGTMLKKGAKTFWEYTPNNARERYELTCHAWSGGCTYLLSAFVLGVRPTAADWEKIIFAPRPCDLMSGRGVVPTTKGLIAVSWEQEAEGGCKFRLALPGEIEVSMDLPENSTIEVMKY